MIMMVEVVSPTALEEVIPINFIDDGSKVYQLEDFNNEWN